MENRLLALKASAGSGKTFNLVVRYLSLCISGVKPSDILALTFTNKAVNEMKSRVLSVIDNLENEPNYLDAISKNLNMSTKKILAMNLKERFLNNDFQISTIDGFFNQILKLFCWYIPIDRDYNIKNDKIEYIQKIFLESLKPNEFENFIYLSSLLNYKTDTLFDILIKFVDNEFEYHLPSPSNKSLDDLVESEKKIWIEFNLLRKFFIDRRDISDKVKSFTAESIDDILEKSWLNKESLNYKHIGKKLYEEILDEYLNRLKHNLKEYFNIKEAIILDRVTEIYLIYKEIRESYKFSNRELTFNDITSNVYRLLSKIDNNFLYFRLDSKFSHILIDEFQDTSVIQFEIIKPLVDEILQDESKSFFYVGDTKQAIYRFRGGEATLFDRVKDNFNIPMKNLNTNYRSEGRVIDFINRVFLQDDIKDKIGYQKQSPKNDTFNGYVEVKILPNGLKKDELLQSVLDSILESILKLKEANVNLNDITILSFKNRNLDEIAVFLENNKINVVTEGSTKLIEQPSNRAIINLIKYLYFKQDIYKYNFLTIMGKDIDDKIEFNVDLLLSVPEVIKTISDNYKIFDEAVLELINISFNFVSITEFVYEIDHIDSKISYASSLNGVRLMTIHKSKGLEIEHLIVVDQFSRDKIIKDKIFKSSSGELKLYHKNREIFDDDYTKAIKSLENDKILDNLNLAYVSFTRAKKSLIILKIDEPMSKFANINLEQSIQGEIISSEILAKDNGIKEIPIELKDFGRQSDFNDSEDEYKPNDVDAIMRGNATHFMLESLQNFDIDSIEIAKEKCRNRYGLYVDIDSISKNIERLLKDEIFQNLIDGNISKEVPLIFNNKIFKIDLMIEKSSKITIIDYKTAQDGANITHNREYKKQVENYIKAISDIKKDSTIDGYLCFIKDSSIELVKV